MPVWKYNDKCYLRANEKKVTEYRVDVSNETPEGKFELFSFTKGMPYIMNLTSYSHEFEKDGNYMQFLFRMTYDTIIYNGIERIIFNKYCKTIFMFITLQSIRRFTMLSKSMWRK